MNHEYRDSEINRYIPAEQFKHLHTPPHPQGGKSDRKRNTTYFQEQYKH
jgi:hypothetical protein